MGDVVASLPTFGRIVGSAGTVLSMAAMAQSTLLLPRGDRGTTLESDPTLSVAWTPLSRRAGWNMAVRKGGVSFFWLSPGLLWCVCGPPPCSYTRHAPRASQLRFCRGAIYHL